MKLSFIVMSVLVIGFVFAVGAFVINDVNTSYPSGTADTSWEDEYNFANEINESLDPIIQGIQNMESENWITVLAEGLGVLFKFITAVPVVIFESFKYIGIIIPKIGEALGIPSFIIYFGIVALTVAIVFAIVSWWHTKSGV